MRQALILEFMPNGRQLRREAWLHPNACTNQPFRRSLSLDWMKIAMDVATALDYLHYHGPTPIIHCDLKPSNVLFLDKDMTAHVGDLGLARFLVAPPLLSSKTDELRGANLLLQGPAKKAKVPSKGRLKLSIDTINGFCYANQHNNQ